MNELDKRPVLHRWRANGYSFAKLIAAHHGLTDEQSAQLNARLVLLLANQLGDEALLEQCIDAARKPFGPYKVPKE